MVARNTPEEKLFPRSAMFEANEYAKSINRQLESLATSDLPDAAVMFVYGTDPTLR